MGFDPFAHAAQLEGNIDLPPHIVWNHFETGTSITDGGLASTTANLGNWLATLTGSTPTALIADDEPGGAWHITTSGSDNDSAEFQINGESFKVAAGKDITFFTKVKFTAAAAPLTSIDWFIGLATTDTTVMDGVTEAIGFGSYESATPGLLNAGSANINFFCGDAMTDWTTVAAYTTGDSTVDYVDDTYVTLGFRVVSNTMVKFYVNGAFVGRSATNIPNGDAVTPTICIQNNAAAAKQMLVDLIYCRQEP